ncbi:MAG: leucyl/phenylalanyl-tRNA--protein transferase [Planctomycetota bacterium]|nr:MAG: leucyl/phenylalanyl-tRNA--protein transferase [Planctomycetota bacterium]
MPVFQLDHRPLFPPGDLAGPDGLLAVGGDLSPERLISAYSQGLFPWPHEGMPLMWFCPDPRMVIVPQQLHASRSLRARLRQGRLTVRFDSAFEQVLEACADTPRPGQDGTWITDDIAEAYVRMHELGLAHSVETWEGDQLVGGLYGVSLGAAFFGESMFSRRSDGSKVALAQLAERLRAWNFHFIDCQMSTPHLASLGACEWRRARFLSALKLALQEPTRRGSWAQSGRRTELVSHLV